MNTVLIVLLIGVAAEGAGSDPCDPSKLLPAYSRLEEEQLLSVTPVEEPPEACASGVERQSNNRAFSFLRCSAPGDNHVLLSTSERTVQFSVREYPWRPLTARWISEKLLFLEFSWNPRAGAYWIFDADREEVVLAERWLEDVVALQRCHGAEGGELK